MEIENKQIPVHPDTILLWKCGTRYKFLCEQKVGILSINFDYTQKNTEKKDSIAPVPPERFQEKFLYENITFTDFSVLNKPIILHTRQNIQKKAEMIADEFSKKKIGYDSLCSALLKEIIIDSVRCALLNTELNSSKIDTCIEYIEQNYNRDISNDELAALSGYHPYHLNRLVKNATGMTLHQYLLNLRIKAANDMLLNTNFSVSEIAEKCGFKNPYYFSAYFKEKMGTTPIQFRSSRINIF